MIKRYVFPVVVTIFIAGSLTLSIRTLFQQSLRLDEAQSLWVSTKTITGILQYIIHDVHVPLYELLLHFWLQIFGANIFFARLLSFIFFLLTLPVLFVIAKQATNKNVALLTITFYSLSPFIIWYSFEARMYALFTFVVCVNHYYFLKMLRTNGEEGEVGYFFSTLFGLYTHYFFFLLLVSQGVFLFIRAFLQSRDPELSRKEFISAGWKVLVKFLIPIFIAIALFIPWLIYFQLQGLASNTQPLIPPPTTYNLFQTLVNFLFGFQSQVVQSILIALWPLSVVPLFFLFSHRTQNIQIRNTIYFILVTILPVVLVFFLSFFKPIFLTRYLIFVTPTFFFLFSWMILHMSKQSSAIVISLFAFIMFGFLLFQNLSNSTPVKENYEGAVTYINQHVAPDDVVMVTAPFTIYPVEYYYTSSAQITTIPEWDVYTAGAIPKYSEASLAKQVAADAKTYRNMYVILSYDQGYEKNIKDFLDHHYKRLMLKKFSPGLELREYQLRY